MPTKRKAVFFDKDGVINEMVDRGEEFRAVRVAGGFTPIRHTAPWDLSEVKYIEGIREMVEVLHERGYLAVVATNQPDATYGFTTEEALDAIISDVGKLGFDDVYVCRHARGGGCACKKPKAGMLHDAAEKWHIDLGNSCMVGDSSVDMEAARSAGVRAVLLEWPYNSEVDADVRIPDIRALAGIL